MLNFLSAEKDLVLSEHNIIYFYTSEETDNLIGNIIFNLISKSNKDIICIDLSYFSTISKRFKINELPTVLVLKNGVETKRITGLKEINEIKNII